LAKGPLPQAAGESVWGAAAMHTAANAATSPLDNKIRRTMFRLLWLK
jgi:hypothetical protein